MSMWTVVRYGKRELELLTGAKPINVSLSPRCRYDPASLFQIMDLTGVPRAYSWGLDEIRFTRLPNRHGEYDPELNMIRLSTDNYSLDIIARVFVHELGHHVDEQLDCSKSLQGELDRCQSDILTSWAKKDVAEYFAIGFEIFYAGWDHEKNALRKNHPELSAAVKKIHRRYRKMSLR